MDQLEKVSYSLGVSIARNLVSQGLTELNIKEFSEALNDVFGKQKTKIDDQEVINILNTYFAELQAKKHAGAKADGEAFLKANKEKEGVVTLPSGLQY